MVLREILDQLYHSPSASMWINFANNHNVGIIRFVHHLNGILYWNWLYSSKVTDLAFIEKW